MFIEVFNRMFVNVGLIEFCWFEDVVIFGFSLFNVGGIIFMIVGIGFCKFLVDRFGKRDVFGYVFFILMFFILVFYIILFIEIGWVFLS